MRKREKKMTRMKKIGAVVTAIAAGIVFAATPGIRATAQASGLMGAKLATDGGEPGKDYMAYLKALQNKDGATLRKMAEIPAGTSDKDLKDQMEMMSAMTPTDQRIMSAKTNKDTAVLKVTGTLEGKSQYGTIEMKKKGGLWKITKEEWGDKWKK